MSIVPPKVGVSSAPDQVSGGCAYWMQCCGTLFKKMWCGVGVGGSWYFDLFCLGFFVCMGFFFFFFFLPPPPNSFVVITVFSICGVGITLEKVILTLSWFQLNLFTLALHQWFAFHHVFNQKNWWVTVLLDRSAFLSLMSPSRVCVCCRITSGDFQSHLFCHLHLLRGKPATAQRRLSDEWFLGYSASTHTLHKLLNITNNSWERLTYRSTVLIPCIRKVWV